MDIRESSMSPDTTLIKRRRSIRKNNSHMNKSIENVPFLIHHDSTAS